MPKKKYVKVTTIGESEDILYDAVLDALAEVGEDKSEEAEVEKTISLSRRIIKKGGAGSGHHDHGGLDGVHGGSTPSGGGKASKGKAAKSEPKDEEPKAWAAAYRTPKKERVKQFIEYVDKDGLHSVYENISRVIRTDDSGDYWFAPDGTILQSDDDHIDVALDALKGLDITDEEWTAAFGESSSQNDYIKMWRGAYQVLFDTDFVRIETTNENTELLVEGSFPLRTKARQLIEDMINSGRYTSVIWEGVKDGKSVSGKDEQELLNIIRRSDEIKERGGVGSGHHGHGGLPGVHGGSSPRGKGKKKQVGITSARPDRGESATVFEDMKDFEEAMRSINTVSDVTVEQGRGGWQGGSEPTWVVSYSGNGEATRLLAETGKQFDQDAVLIYEAADEGKGSPLVDWLFDTRISDGEREIIEELLPETGVFGWTWYKQAGSGNSVLRAVAVPQWGGEREAHLEAAAKLDEIFSASGLNFTRNEADVNVTVMEREGDYAYDAVLGE